MRSNPQGPVHAVIKINHLCFNFIFIIFITLSKHLFQSQENVLIRFTDTFGREGVNDFEIEKRLRLSYAAARVLYSTFLLHYLAVFGGVLDDHRHFCVWFLF